MTSLLAELSAIAGNAFAAEGLDAGLGRVQFATVPTWRNSSAMALCRGEKRQSQSARHRRKDRRAAEGRGNLLARWRSPVPAFSISTCR